MKLNLFLTFVFVQTIAFAQLEASNWYFGQNAGIKFDVNGNVTALTDGKLDTPEGCTAISDSNGNLSFYSDGTTIWNKNHSVMQNGAGLMGHYSTTQSAIIVPLPGSSTIFYVFTLDYEVHVNGFRYSIVDISLDAGLGAVTTKNVLIYTPSDEKIAVTKNANNIDYWIVTHDWNNSNYVSYSLTASGLNTVPIVSSVGYFVGGSTDNVWGCMKISPDGKKLAICHSYNLCALLDFDNATGVVSNYLVILQYSLNNSYGVEFSPNSRFLYVSGTLPKYVIFQFDMTAPDIVASRYETILTTPPSAMQLGPNNKLYFGQVYKSKLGVINNPNDLGIACNIQENAVDLLGRKCDLGLPPFVASFFNVAFTSNSLCLNGITSFTINNSQPLTNITWDFGDGSSSSLPNPSHQYLLSGTYNVSLTATSTSGTSTKTQKINISTIPIIASTVANILTCNAAITPYNLSQHNSTLLGSQNPAVFGVAYFLTSTDLANHNNILPNNYTFPCGTTTVHAKVFNLQNVNCYANITFTISYGKQPIANPLTDYVICESAPFDNIENFTFSSQNAALLGSQSAVDFECKYFLTQSDADADTNQLPNSYANVTNPQTIVARIDSKNESRCYATTTLVLQVIQVPITVAVTDFRVCDDATNDGLASFDLSLKTNEILNVQSPSIFEVRYFKSILESYNNNNAIVVPIINTVQNQTVFYKINAKGNANCATTGSFNLIVDRLPTVSGTNNIYKCDDVSNDGKDTFDLSINNATMLGTQSAVDSVVNFYSSQTNADGNISALPVNYSNISNPETIFVRVHNKNNPTCFVTASFLIGLRTLPKANKPTPMITCDDASNNGSEIFDLSIQNPLIILTQNPADNAVTYHLSQNEANLNLNKIINSTAFSNTINPQTIYARISNNLSIDCFDTTTFDLIVRAKPILKLDSFYSICEGKTITVTAPTGFSSYDWSNGTKINETTFTKAGNYSLTVTKNYGDIVCNDTKNITIYNSNIATITKIETQDWTDNQNTIAVYVTGDGDYQYSIDGINYQDSSQFIGLLNGSYSVFVKDTKGCGISQKDNVFLLMYPKFFTPNNDGFNDTWKIEFSDSEPDMQLIIYDRFGKLLKQFSTIGAGWDGIYNAKQLPADDYWFAIYRKNQTTYKGHFTLKR